jgi:diguanylate cyclase (GGDEF)-like protein/putative nucleotidyltransferase with HDIG domain
MKTLPLAARIYVSTIIALGGVLLVANFPTRLVGNPWLFLALLFLSSLTSVFKVNLPLARRSSTMSVSYAVDFASLLLLGPNETMLVAAASAFSQCTFRIKERNPMHRTLFSMACLVVTVQAAGGAYTLLGGYPGPRSVASLAVTMPLVAAATVYFLFNTLTVATAIALSVKQSLTKVWYENFLWSAPSYFVGAGAAAGVAWVANLQQQWVALLPLLGAPIYLTYYTYKVYLGRVEDERRHTQEMADLHLATIEALALAIDAKDQTSQLHIRRVQLYAAALARGLGMSENEIQGVKTAALLHDIGKLAVPEHILSKPGPLTPEEFQKIRAHPTVGADIVSSVPFPYPVAPLILSHHERWDGKGYPAGLKGEEIPLGARILSVVDYFDALMAERPYHKAMSSEAAIALLQQEAGRGLDPQVVAMFTDLLPTLQQEALTLDHNVRRNAPQDANPQAQPATGLAPEQSKKNVFEDIALAHREIYALYEIAQAMGTSLGVSDTMALISAKLTNLVPFACAALFLYDEESETLRCRFATGTDADVIQQISVHSGDGLTGWVARNRRPLVNARPSADLEAAGLMNITTTLQSALVCPLMFNERFIGTLSVYHTDAAFYRDDHRRLLDRVSEQAAAVINNSMLFEQTQEDSLTDPLTGLPNTRFLFMHLTRELARAERLKAEVSLMVMDLDSFKEINDSHGHHVGDRALCEVARVLRAAIRPYDICVRYAGDEFIIVLSGCSADEAEHKRQELQKAIDDVYFEARPGKRLQLGISIGAAVFPQDGESYEALLSTADSRMYQDKASRKRKSGRDYPPSSGVAGGNTPFSDLSDIDIQRAAAGIL